MRKVLLSVAVCLACLFMFCSCEQTLPENGFVGTWKYEDAENVTYRLPRSIRRTGGIKEI